MKFSSFAFQSCPWRLASLSQQILGPRSLFGLFNYHEVCLYTVECLGGLEKSIETVMEGCGWAVEWGLEWRCKRFHRCERSKHPATNAIYRWLRRLGTLELASLFHDAMDDGSGHIFVLGTHSMHHRYI